MTSLRTVLVVGAGIFGITAAVELADRGFDVCLVDRGPIPHPSAASTDISKAVRADYGDDASYTSFMVDCLDGWRAWNRTFGVDVFHETGMLLLAAGALDAGGFEADSNRTVEAAGLPVERLTTADIEGRFPLFAARGEASLSHAGGFAESGRVVALLVAHARAIGVEIVETAVTSLLLDGGRVRGVATVDGELTADVIVVAAGVWTPTLVPGLDDLITVTAQPVIHLAPADPTPFRPEVFPTWAADVTATGWYGFPLHEGVVKLANHGVGRPAEADDDRLLDDVWVERCRAFLHTWLPTLADAPVVSTHSCLYTDTVDGDLLIDRHPSIDDLVVATGGSGHAFKFAPRLGAVVADVVEGGEASGIAERFRWRQAESGRREAARAAHRPSLPDGLELQRTTADFDEHSVPAGLLRAHQVAEGVWGRLIVRTGTVRLVFEASGEAVAVRAGESAVIPPTERHHVELGARAVFAVEFWR